MRDSDPTAEASVRKVGRHVSYLTLFTVSFFLLGITTIPRLPHDAFIHPGNVPTVLQITMDASGLMVLAALFFWLSVPILIYRSIRILKQQGFDTSWGWIVTAILMGGILFLFGSIIAGWLFYKSKKEQ